MSQGRLVRRLSLASLVVLSLAASATIALAIPSPAPAAITLGPNPLPQRTSVISSAGARIFANNVVPGASLTAPLDGVVVRWRVRRGPGPGTLEATTLTLRILRPTGVANEFTASGTSDAHAVPSGSSDPIDIYEFPTQLPIKTNDRLGLGTTPVSEFAALELAGASYLRTNALDDGQTAIFDVGAFADRAVLMNADIEADCDQDGLGDETQDADLSACHSNAFTFAGVTRNKKKGTATLKVNVPEPGQLIGSGNGAKVAAAGATISKAVAPGTAQLLIKAKGKKKRKLNQTGKVKLSVAVTYTPTGGKPNTQSIKVKLKKNL
jgi:hypothetical protein